MTTITLKELLNFFDFDYKINKNKTFSVVDLQGANLGDIESEKYKLNTTGINALVERLLSVYGQSYIFDDLAETTDHAWLRSTELDTAFEFAQKHKVFVPQETLQIMEALLDPKKITW